MYRHIFGKLTLIIVFIPILHIVGFYYARFHPSFFRPGGLNRNLAAGADYSYTDYLERIFLNGDFGHVGGADMVDLVSKPFFNSLFLIILAILFTAIGGVLLGFLAVSPREMHIRPLGLLLTSAGASIPGFLLGGVVIAIIVYQTLYGGLKQTWLPMSGCGQQYPLPFSSCGFDKHLILPLIVLAVRPMLHVARVTAGLLESELHKNYIRTARSKGARWIRIYWTHAMRNILAPIIILLGQSLRFIVGGLLIAELMFFWPGIGRFFVYAIVANENLRGQFRFFAHPELIATLAVLMGAIILVADLIASLAAHLADPRLREHL